MTTQHSKPKQAPHYDGRGNWSGQLPHTDLIEQADTAEPERPLLAGFPDAWARRKFILAQDLHRSEKLVLMTLEAYADIATGLVVGPRGQYFLLRDMAPLTGIKQRQLRRILRALEEAGHLRIERHNRDGRGSTYHMTCPQVMEDLGAGHGRPGGRSLETHPQVMEDPSTGRESPRPRSPAASYLSPSSPLSSPLSSPTAVQERERIEPERGEEGIETSPQPQALDAWLAERRNALREMGWKSTSGAVRHYSYNPEDLERDRLDIERLHGEINPVSTYSDVVRGQWVNEREVHKRVEALHEEGSSVEEIHASGIPFDGDLLSKTGIIGIIERYEARRPKKREHVQPRRRGRRPVEEDGPADDAPELRRAFANDWLARTFGTFQEQEKSAE